MISKIKVKCDNPSCNWVKEVSEDEIKEWHNKLCPSCNECIIVSDKDIEVHNALKLLISFSEEMGTRIDIESETKGLKTCIKSEDITGGNYDKDRS